MSIVLTKITAAQNEVALSYDKVRGLYFWQILMQQLWFDQETVGYLATTIAANT